MHKNVPSARSELSTLVRGVRALTRAVKKSDPDKNFLERDILWPVGKSIPAKPARRLGAVEGSCAASGGRFAVPPSLAGHTNLDSLEKAVRGCLSCPLGKTRTHFVFGEGNPNARLMFVGEGPGRDEDIQGRPFVGRAGQLLTKIIEAMGYRRQDVYIANVIKCRPPNNRPPEPEEIKCCWPYLTAQIRTIRPTVICALGTHAARTLLDVEIPIGAMRGKFYDVEGIKIMPTYHPAYLLRNPHDKGKVWEDMKKVRDFLKAMPQ